MKQDPAAAKSQKIAKRKKGVIKAKSEFFRTARYGLTLQEHRIIYYAVLKGQQDGTPFAPVTLPVQDFIELCELKGHSTYDNVRRASKKLIGKSVEVVFKDQDGAHLLQAPWLKAVKYNSKQGSVTITPNDELKPFFEGKPFSTTEYYFLIKFTSQYAERLYELLKSLNHKTVVDFDIDDLAERLAAPPSVKKNYADLYKRVLEPAIKDINEFTDIDVELREKRGRYNKVSTVFFSVIQKKVPKLADRVERGEFRPPLSDEEQTSFMRELLGGDFPEQQLEGQLSLEDGQ
jgi:plasmid replication initiation protein